jgi:hypothetical protein
VKYILILILSFSLQGCAFLDYFKKHEPNIVTQTVKLDPKLLEYCELLKENPTVATFEDAVLVYSDVVNAYATCANKQANGVKTIKQMGNIK